QHSRQQNTMTTNTVRRARLSNKVRRSWCVREKLMVVHYLERGHSIKSTARKFDIQPKQVREWQNKKRNLQKAAAHILKVHGGRPAKYPVLEKRLVEWYSELRKKGNA